MAEGKWIDHLKGTTLLTEAARHVLLARLQVVRDILPKALDEADDDPEYVHQLRVGTRRADAALRIFELCLPERVWRKTRRRLRRLRRAAGVARDLDVFVLALLERQQTRPAREQPGLDFLVGHALGQRGDAQQQLLEAGRRAGTNFDDFLRDVLLAIRPPPDVSANATLHALAGPLLSNRLHDLEDKARRDLSDYAQLHEVRIAGKRLRYAMEVFASCFGTAFRQTLYPRVEAMQEILGRANDSHVAIERLEQVRASLRAAWPAAWKRLAPGIEAALRLHQHHLPVEQRRFLRWWQQWQKVGSRQLQEFLHTAVV